MIDSTNKPYHPILKDLVTQRGLLIISISFSSLALDKLGILAIQVQEVLDEQIVNTLVSPK
jgi:hypothetical protein